MIVLTLTTCRCRDRRKRDWRTHFTTRAQHTTEATVAGRKKNAAKTGDAKNGRRAPSAVVGYLRTRFPQNAIIVIRLNANIKHCSPFCRFVGYKNNLQISVVFF